MIRYLFCIAIFYSFFIQTMEQSSAVESGLRRSTRPTKRKLLVKEEVYESEDSAADGEFFPEPESEPEAKKNKTISPKNVGAVVPNSKMAAKKDALERRKAYLNSLPVMDYHDLTKSPDESPEERLVNAIIYHESVEYIGQIIGEKPAIVNESLNKKGDTALHLAVRKYDERCLLAPYHQPTLGVIDYLLRYLKKGKSPGNKKNSANKTFELIKNNDDKTALELTKKPEAIKLFERYGARYTIDMLLNAIYHEETLEKAEIVLGYVKDLATLARRDNGDTALHAVVRKYHYERVAYPNRESTFADVIKFIKLLRTLGASAVARDFNGTRPLDLCEDGAIKELLISKNIIAENPKQETATNSAASVESSITISNNNNNGNKAENPEQEQPQLVDVKVEPLFLATSSNNNNNNNNWERGAPPFLMNSLEHEDWLNSHESDIFELPEDDVPGGLPFDEQVQESNFNLNDLFDAIGRADSAGVKNIINDARHLLKQAEETTRNTPLHEAFLCFNKFYETGLEENALDIIRTLLAAHPSLVEARASLLELNKNDEVALMLCERPLVVAEFLKQKDR